MPRMARILAGSTSIPLCRARDFAWSASGGKREGFCAVQGIQVFYNATWFCKNMVLQL